MVSGFSTWQDEIELNNLTREMNLPFYCLKSSGLFAFAYVDLGKELTFRHSNLEDGK